MKLLSTLAASTAVVAAVLTSSPAMAAPSDVIDTECGTSQVTLDHNGRGRLTGRTGFTVNDQRAVAYTWQVVVTGENSSTTFDYSGTLNSRTWRGTINATAFGGGDYTAEVTRGEITLADGTVCDAAGPTETVHVED